jgi:hypothetical protein
MAIWLRRSADSGEEAAADRAFWAVLTPDERVATIACLRAEWLTMRGLRDEGLGRVVRVFGPPRR